MPRLSRAQETARQRIAQLAGRGLLPEQLASALLAALHGAIPSDGQQLSGVDPATLLYNRLLAVSPDFAHHTRHYLRHLYLAEPQAELSPQGMMRARRFALILHERPERAWGMSPQLVTAESYRFYHEVAGPDGGVLRACFFADGQGIAVLEMARFDASRPFQPGDIEFLRLVAPAIGRALRAALDRERALTSVDTNGPDAPGILVLAPDGRTRFHTPAAAGWIALLHDAVGGGVGHLPMPVWSVLAGLRASRAAGEQTPPIVLVPTPAGLVRVEASPGSEGDEVAVVLTPERPPLPPELPRSWPLTRQERQVALLVVQGLSNRQIAASLCISDNTVETHLRHAYEKLDVHSRSQLQARFFREAYLPSWREPGAAEMPDAPRVTRAPGGQ